MALALRFSALVWKGEGEGGQHLRRVFVSQAVASSSFTRI